ncbi:hypothetical protein BRD18_08720 [Halobacteriales archaeon SW_7_71_33]|nr:MAG: hypothetical protein BRD18_08720 [Halobacteriales archaeon SW_7_71_33]
MVGELRASHVIHLHRLLAAVRAEFEEDGLDDRRLEAYEEHDVAPAEFKATKVEHEQALTALSATLAEWAGERTAAGGGTATTTGTNPDVEVGEEGDVGLPAEPPEAEAGASR